MAERPRMTTAREAVEQFMQSEHADVLKESVAFMIGELIEAELAALARRRTRRARARAAPDAAQRLPAPRLADARRRARLGDPEAAARVVHAVVS